MGLLIGAYAYENPGFMSLIPKDKLDYMVPVFVLNYLPHGLIGFIVVALVAAFMSSLDSSINSLSAASMKDIYQKYVNSNSDAAHYYRWSKIMTVFWGVVCTGFAFVVGGISDTIIEAINKVGSLFYGPVLAAFLLGLLFKSSGPSGVKLGVLTGIAVHLVLWLGFPEISWLWWNLTGCASAVAVGYAVSLLYPYDGYTAGVYKSPQDGHGKWKKRYILLVSYMIVILLLSYLADRYWLK